MRTLQGMENENEFHWKNRLLGIRADTCKVCKGKQDASYCQRHHAERRRKVNEYLARRRQIAREFVFNYLSYEICEVCGEYRPETLQFDHLHGDGCVWEGFYQKMERPFAERAEIGAAFCRYITIDERGRWLSISPLEQPCSGVLPGWLEKIAAGQRLQPPAMVVRREVYERLGAFDRRIARYGEDWEMWVRIAAHYPVWHEVEPLALYRVHAASLSGNRLRVGENADDLRQVIALIQPYLPPGRARALSGEARRNFALACIRRAHRLLGAGDKYTAASQAREALKTDRSPAVLARALYLFLRLSGSKIRLAAPAAGEEPSRVDG